MSFLLDVNWISILVLGIVILSFFGIHWLSNRINWALVILISLVIGVIVGIVFASDNNRYLIWTDLIGKIYVNAITALVAPVIMISIISGFISLRDGNKIKTIGFKSVFWLLLSATVAIVLSILFGLITKIGKNAGSIFESINTVSDGTISAYSGLTRSFDDVILDLFPSNIVGDLLANNVVAIIIIGIVIALAYINIVKNEGKDLSTFSNLIFETRKIFYKIMEFVVDLTPYAIVCLIAGSASKIFMNKDAILQLVLLVLLIYAVSIIHAYGYHAIVLKFVAKLNPIKYFKKTFSSQITAFTTQSSVGTLPVTIEDLTKKVGVDSQVANFTAPLGTTIGMPGCTCIWPVLLAIFYINATGVQWGVGNYIILGVLTLLLSFGSAGVPGIAVVSAVALFGVLDLPIAAVILLVPINTISDMIRTFDNVTTASVSATLVASQTDLINREIFNNQDKPQNVEVDQGSKGGEHETI